MNSQEPIHARYVWEFRDVLEGRRAHWRTQLRPPFRFAAYAMLAVMSSFGLAFFLVPKSKPMSVPLITFASMLVAATPYWLLLRPLGLRRALRRRFDAHPGKEAECLFSFGEVNLECRIGELVYYYFRWDYIGKVVVAPTGILVYPADMVFFLWVPRRGFKTDEEFERARSLIVARMGGAVPSE